MNSYGSSHTGFALSPQRHDFQQLFSGASDGGFLGISDQQDPQDPQPLTLGQQHANQMRNIQKQSAFHTRVRDLYFASWGQPPRSQPQLHLSKSSESAWQGHKNPKVYEGDEVHCFNSFCTMTFRYHQHLVSHIMASECGEITMPEVSSLVRDWKALQLELSRCGKLTSDEIACLERAWDCLLSEQQKIRTITQELVGYLVLAWEILSGNRSRYTLNPPSAASLLMMQDERQDSSTAEGEQGWRARFRYSTGNSKNR